MTEKAKELCYDFNQLRPSDEAGQKAILQKLLGRVGKNFSITAPFWCDYGYNIELDAMPLLQRRFCPKQTAQGLFAICSKVHQRKAIFVRYNKGAVREDGKREPLPRTCAMQANE